MIVAGNKKFLIEMEFGMGILSWIAVGVLAGIVAGVMRGGSRGIIGDFIVSLIGSLAGGWIGTVLMHITAGIYVINWTSILVALGGAELLILVLRQGIFWGASSKESWRQLG